MNRVFRSIWNDVTRTYVAVSECVTGKGKAAGGSCVDSVAAGALSTGKTRKRLRRSGAALLCLEQRFMFDGAGFATAHTEPAHATPDAIEHAAAAQTDTAK
ncbi:MAG: hypothetical protein H7Z39_05435, partial [Burkholderiaceae bacterium]|nr:hypothetical protein [Burkholderiaceae bacterium]